MGCCGRILRSYLPRSNERAKGAFPQSRWDGSILSVCSRAEVRVSSQRGLLEVSAEEFSKFSLPIVIQRVGFRVLTIRKRREPRLGVFFSNANDAIAALWPGSRAGVRL